VHLQKIKADLNITHHSDLVMRHMAVSMAIAVCMTIELSMQQMLQGVPAAAIQ